MGSTGSQLQAEAALRFARHPGKPLPSWRKPTLARSECAPYPFAYARTALKYGLGALGLGAGDELLVPGFICESLVEPMVQLGIRPRYYPVGPALAPDWEQLRALLTADVRGLVVVHFFGQPQALEPCLEFARERGLLLIEDNAHGYGATHQGRLLGTFGDLGISAPRKSFPVDNGAYLYLAKDGGVDTGKLRPPSQGAAFRPWARRVLERLPGTSQWLRTRGLGEERRRRAGPPPAYHSQEAFRDAPIQADYGMAASTHRYLVQQDLESVRVKRQGIYELWYGWSQAQGLMPLFPELARGAMPLVFPALAPSPAESRRWFERGHRNGVDIHSWPTLPEEIVAQDGPDMRLWERLVCFPIHQGMDEAELQRRIQVL